jgi:hypothetical protein
MTSIYVHDILEGRGGERKEGKKGSRQGREGSIGGKKGGKGREGGGREGGGKGRKDKQPSCIYTMYSN